MPTAELSETAAARHEGGEGRPYAAQVLPHVRRALAMLDRAPASRTHGCFDRAFWYYRTLTNFPGSGWQQLALAMALVCSTRAPGNPYFDDPEVRSAAVAGSAWWARIQHRDGSFDEWYRNEHSYCPTAFTAAGIGRALLVLGESMPASASEKVIEALEKAGRWLSRRYNPAVMNQNLAAAAGLAALHALTGDARWLDALDSKLARLAADQTREGWFPEYGGCDLGYSTLSLDMLAQIDLLTGDGRAGTMAHRLADFLAAVTDGFPLLPGRLGSRGTAHLFPAGADYFAARCESAAVLAGLWREAHAAGLATGPGDVDDRYFAYFYLPQFALAYYGGGA